MHRTTEPKTWPNPRHPWIVLCSDAFSWPCLTKMIDMPYRFDEFSRRILHGFESPSNDESHEQFAFLSLCFFSFLQGWYWYTVPQGRFFVWTLAGVTFSSCIDLSFYCCCLMIWFCMSGMGWIVMIMMWWFASVFFCCCSAFAFVSVYFLSSICHG